MVSRFSMIGCAKGDASLEALGMAKLIDLQPVRATMLKTKTDAAVRFI
jgi:hypothetical protein